MKNFKFITIVLFLLLSISSYAQITVNSSGKVGINNTSPSYNLDLYGTARFWTTWGYLIFDSSGASGSAVLYPQEDWVGALGKMDKRFNSVCAYNVNYNNLYDWSDERLKENIKPMVSSLDRIKLLKGVTYNMRKEFYNINDAELLSKVMSENKVDFGFLAQEAKEVFPEIVSLDSTNDLYSIYYVKLIPVLVDAIQELETQVETLKNNCCNQNESLKSASTTSQVTTSNLDEAKLFQNTPNPFSDRTEIKCYIPANTSNSSLYIFNMQGLQIEEFQISETGNQLVEISASHFNPGMYLYSLVLDGKEIDTKKMILTK